MKNNIFFNFTALPLSLIRNKTLLWQLIKRNILSRYKGSALGIIWSFVHPLLMLCVYTFVFSIVLKSRWNIDFGGKRGAFAVIMFCGLSIFNIFSESVKMSCGCIIDNPNYVKKVVFPLEILPFVQTSSCFILGFVWFILLFLGAAFIIGKIYFTMLLLPFILLPLFIFTLGISFFVASLTVYIRDTLYLIGIILQILFFITPIFYPLEAVPPKYQWPMQLNPLARLVEEARKVFLYGILPNWGFLLWILLLSCVVLHLGFVWFYKTKKGFADVL